jgi:acetyl esterase/lipase
MGSSYFYLEFLMAWTTCLKERGFRNPSLFALEYSLVPEAAWPTQFNETRNGYRFLLDSFGEGAAAKICVCGDSAGATLLLSMLLHPGSLDKEPQFDTLVRPGLAILLSPWTHLVSDLNTNTGSDYLNKDSLHLYAKQYAGKDTQTNSVVSPGLSHGKWSKASPQGGFRIIHGSEEVFTPGIQEMVKHMKSDGANVVVHSHRAGIHAWPVVNLFLGETRKERLEGLDVMTNFVMSSNIVPADHAIERRT